jgi:hypothetical protein
LIFDRASLTVALSVVFATKGGGALRRRGRGVLVGPSQLHGGPDREHRYHDRNEARAGTPSFRVLGRVAGRRTSGR